MDCSVLNESILPPNIKKMSVSEREIDVLAEHILNQNEKSSSQLATNPGIAALWEDERVLRRNCGISSQISQCLTNERIDIKPTNTHFVFKELLAEKLIMSSESDESLTPHSSSIYPAETPESCDLMAASRLDNHSPFTSQSDNEDQSLILDERGQALLEALNDLRENANELEEDSVLSQRAKDFELESDDDFDFSIVLNSPVNAEADNQKMDWSDTLDSFKIPQLDGVCLDDSDDFCQRSRLSVLKIDLDKMLNTSNCKVHLPTIQHKNMKRKELSNHIPINVNIISNKLLQGHEKYDVEDVLSNGFNRFVIPSNKVYFTNLKRYNITLMDLSLCMNKVLKVKINNLNLKNLSKCNGFKRNNKIKVITLDGANDSSSDENLSEDCSTPKKGRKTAKRSKNVSPKYTPLNITTIKSPKKRLNLTKSK